MGVKFLNKQVVKGIVIGGIISILITSLSFASNNNDIKVVSKGVELKFDVPPQIIDGRTLVPLRAIFESLGATVNWDSSTGTIIGIKGNTSLILNLNKREAKLNGKDIWLDAAPISVNGRTLVPLRIVSESLGMKVDWDGANSTVKIDSVAPTPTNTLEPTRKPTATPTPTVKPTPTNTPIPTLTQTMDDVTIKINKVIQDNDSLRLYITYTNNSNKTILTGDSLSKIVCNGKQYKYVSDFNFDRYYDKNVENAPSSIEPTVSANSVLFFEPIANVDTINVVLYIDFDDYKFNNVKVLKGQVNNVVISATPTPTNKPSSTTIPSTLSTAQDLKSYLEQNYSTLNTCIGTTNFTFNIYENSVSYVVFDYWIQVEYDYNFFDGAMMSIKYTDEQKNKLRQELKSHQENLAKAIIKLMPTKKIYGGYYRSWYKYPNIKSDLQTLRYYSWQNYEEPSYSIPANQMYNSSKPSSFRWYDSIDDKL